MNKHREKKNDRVSALLFLVGYPPTKVRVSFSYLRPRLSATVHPREKFENYRDSCNLFQDDEGGSNSHVLLLKNNPQSTMINATNQILFKFLISIFVIFFFFLLCLEF